MGELSKKIGEDGEAIALSFFRRIGWTPIQTGIDIHCSEPSEHALKRSKTARTKHGLDLLFSYVCPLVPRTRRNVLISMKNSDFERTHNRQSLVRDDLRELDFLLNCFSFSPNRAELQSEGGADSVRDYGILIRINRDKNVDASFIGGDGESLGRQPTTNDLFFVENNRFDFVDSCMNYLDFNLRESSNLFNIHRNSLSLGGEVRLVESPILPLQSLVGGPIIVRSTGKDKKSLIVFSNEAFSESALKKLIGIALQCSNGWPSEVRIVASGYDRTQADIVERVCGQIHDKAFAATIRCDSFEIKSRLK